MNDRELTRLADAAGALRPDWNPASVRAFLAKECRHRAFADAAVALAAIAADETQATPRLLGVQGARCWRAAQAVVAMHAGESPELPHPKCEHGQPVSRCDDCEAEATDGPPPWWPRGVAS